MPLFAGCIVRGVRKGRMPCALAAATKEGGNGMTKVIRMTDVVGGEKSRRGHEEKWRVLLPRASEVLDRYHEWMPRRS
jgi:hypothetical protein